MRRQSTIGREDAESTPFLSAIVISQDDEDRIERAVRSVVEQECPEPFEVIVVTSGSDRTAALVRAQFPDVTLIELDRPALPGEARNAGLRVASGRYVSFPGSHIELPAGSLAARMRAHRRGHALVTGTVLNGTTTWAGWASYFLDNRSVLQGRPSGELSGPPVRCSYVREALVEVGCFPTGMRTAEDTFVNERLFERGYRAYRSSELVLVHRSPCSRPGLLVRHHFTRGRGIGCMLLREASETGAFPRRRALVYLLGGMPARLLVTTASVLRWGSGLRRHYWLALPLVIAAATSWWFGICYELLRGRRSTAPAEVAALGQGPG